MKIAIVASGLGEKALYLYEFFKEGNRVEVKALLTDDEESPVSKFFKAAGVPVTGIGQLSEEETGDIASRLKNEGVELLVVDGFEGEIPAALREEFSEAVLYPSGVQETPLEIIGVEKRQKAEAMNALHPEEQKEPDAIEVREEDVEEKAAEDVEERDLTPEDEWARELNMPITPPSLEERAEAKPEPPKPTGFGEAPGSPYVPPRQAPQYQAPLQTPPEAPQFQQAPQKQEEMPNSYLVWSVLATILCCLIPGIIAIVFSSSVSSKYYAGDVEGAKRASRNAQIWIIVSVVTGIIWGTLYLPMALFVG